MAKNQKVKPSRSKGMRRVSRRGKDEEEAETSRRSWRTLPADVATRIFSLLPLYEAMNAKAVCRQWRDLLQAIITRLLEEKQDLNISFLSAPSDLLLPVLCPNPRRTSLWFAFHPISQTWKRFPAFLLPGFHIMYPILSSHKGLLLLRNAETSQFHVYNLFTHDHRPLPLPPSHLLPGHRNQYTHHESSLTRRNRIHHSHLHVEDDLLSYSVYVIFSDVSSSQGLISWPQDWARFDSKIDQWQPLSVHSPIQIPPAYFKDIDRIVVLHDAIYTVVKDRYNTTNLLVRYHMSTSMWSLVSDLRSPAYATVVRLRDSLVLATAPQNSFHIYLYSFGHGADTDQLEQIGCTEGRADLHSFLSNCSNNYWYATASTNPPCIYILQKEDVEAILEYNVVYQTWKLIPIPRHMTEPEDCCIASCVCLDGYELGLKTRVTFRNTSED